MKSISQKLQDDIRAIMEANIKHPNQQAIDVHEPEKDEITAHDFKKLRAMKKDQHGKITKEDTDDQIQELAGKAAQQAAIAISLIKAGKKDGKMPKPMKEDSEQVEEEEKKKVVSPFDYKNYTSQIPKKPGEMTGHDSKKISTGTVYTKKPVKENTDIEEARKLEGTYKHTNGHESKVYKLSGEHNEGDPYHVKLFKGGKHYEPADYFTNDKDDAHSTAKHMVKEESHQSATTMKHIPNASPALKKAAKDIKPGVAGYRDRIDMLKAGGVKEEVEQEEYTFADYLEAARAQYVDEDAVLVANEAFKNQDITLFNYQSQSPEA